MDSDQVDLGTTGEPRRISIDVPAGYMVSVTLTPWEPREDEDGEAQDDQDPAG